MKKLICLATIFVVSGTANAQYNSAPMLGQLKKDKAAFINSLPAALAKDDESTVLRAHLLSSVVCHIPSAAADILCKDIRASEDLEGQRSALLEFGLNSKNLNIVLRALSGVYQSAQNSLPDDKKNEVKDMLTDVGAALAMVNDAEKAADKMVAAFQARLSLEDTFGSLQPLKAFLPLLSEVKVWLKMKPAGRGEEWRLVAAQIREQENLYCRIFQSGGFRCWHILADKTRIPVATENFPGYKLYSVPTARDWEYEFNICSRNEDKFFCWIGLSRPNNETRHERCSGRLVDKSDVDVMSMGMMRSDEIVALKCPTLGNMAVAIDKIHGTPKPLDHTQHVAPFRAVDLKIGPVTRPRNEKTAAMFFMNYHCVYPQYGSGLISDFKCRHIGAGPKPKIFRVPEGLHAYDPVDIQSDDPLAGFYPGAKKSGLSTSRDTICAHVESPKRKYACRRFFREERGLVAVDFNLEGFENLYGDMHLDGPTPYIVDTVGHSPRIRYWRFEGYRVVISVVRLNLGLKAPTLTSVATYSPDFNFACWDHEKGPYWSDKHKYHSNLKCGRFSPEGTLLYEIYMPPYLKNMSDWKQVGGALCISSPLTGSVSSENNRVICDTYNDRIFQEPILNYEAPLRSGEDGLHHRTKYFYADETNERLCLYQADSMTCTDYAKLKFNQAERNFPTYSQTFSPKWWRYLKIFGWDEVKVMPNEPPWICLKEDHGYVCQTPDAKSKSAVITFEGPAQ